MRVLIAGGNPATLRLLRESLTKSGYDVVTVTSGGQAEDVLLQGEVHIAICDWTLPDLNAVELCRRVRSSLQGSFPYILVLDEGATQEQLAEGVRAGVDDYVATPITAQELDLRIRTAQRVVDLQTELAETQRRLLQTATHDGLTGLWNHQAALSMLDREFVRAAREKRRLAVAMVDLDRFKNVNDLWGHPTGDAVLVEVASRLERSVRPYDVVGRYGGEEFLLVMPGCDCETGLRVAERVRLSVSDHSIGTAQGLVTVTTSIGVAGSDRVPASQSSDLVRAADTALYKAKAAGRNCVACACDP